MQIATSGQSLQSLLFCLSGQHGMSAAVLGISAICTISATMECSATAGVASGAIANPAAIPSVHKFASENYTELSAASFLPMERPVRQFKHLNIINMQGSAVSRRTISGTVSQLQLKAIPAAITPASDRYRNRRYERDSHSICRAANLEHSRLARCDGSRL